MKITDICFRYQIHDLVIKIFLKQINAKLKQKEQKSTPASGGVGVL